MMLIFLIICMMEKIYGLSNIDKYTGEMIQNSSIVFFTILLFNSLNNYLIIVSKKVILLGKQEQSTNRAKDYVQKTLL